MLVDPTGTYVKEVKRLIDKTDSPFSKAAILCGACMGTSG